MQKCIDRQYRFIWNKTGEAPLKTIQHSRQDARNFLGIQSIQLNIQ